MRDILEQKCGLKAGLPVLVGVSGGADSLALLHFLHGAGYAITCATFDHRLRPEAAQEAARVRELAERLGVPFVTDSADVAAHAAVEGLSIEQAARTLRYRFLFRVARAAGAQAVAVGHTADDQAETVLMHFLRGAGLSGLKGMPYRAVLPVFDAELPLVRPLLDWRRADTETYCGENGLAPIDDPSNADTAYFRNRLRHELLPQLESYNPRVRQALARSAQALQGDESLLAEVVEAAWQKCVIEQGAGYIGFKLSALEDRSPALRRNLFRRAAFALRPGLRDVDFDALQRAATLRATDIAGGLKTLVEGSILYVSADESALPAYYPKIDRQFLISPGQTDLENGWTLNCEHLESLYWSWSGDGLLAFVDADVIGERLYLRPAVPGDRFEPLGMPDQRMKISDFFVNKRVPKRLRKNWPVLCAGDEIAWVVGLRMGHSFRVREDTKRILKIEVIKE